MTTPQHQILGILLVTIILFFWGRWRHDLVAGAALLACVLCGLVSAESAFAGFAHPAVITVACVLIMSRGLQETGAVDRLAQAVLPRDAGPIVGGAALAGIGAGLSAFMNNVGAMALLMPVGIQLARRWEISPSQVLMPLAFATILGGMTTLIGTPSNLIVSGFRAQTEAGSFAMFDFAPVGWGVAAAGLLFVTLVGRYLVPSRKQGGVEDFDTGAYLVEATLKDKSKAIGKTLSEAEALLEKPGAQIVGLVRNKIRLHAPNFRRRIKAGDILVIEAEPEDLAAALSSLELSVDDGKEPAAAEKPQPAPGEDAEVKAEPVELQELVIMPGSGLAGRSSVSMQIRTQHGINLLAVSRQGQRSIRRLGAMKFRAGDLLLLQGPPEVLREFAREYGLVPLADRNIRLPQSSRALVASGIMVAAIAVAAIGWLPAAVSFALGVLAMGFSGIIRPRDLYHAVDWPVIVLLAMLIPVAGATASTGVADLMADGMLHFVAQDSPVIALGLIMVVTMVMSDFMNNAATAAVMCPIALSTAHQLGVNSDPFLMSVAIGASCAFLTPVGHQNNTLILGPAGLRFGDYWRLGLPLELVVLGVGMPLLLWAWPF
jgi:di/tricarboxylate transporter